MRKIILFLSLFSCLNWGFSQQIPHYSQWFWNQFAMNPAHAGIKPCVEIKSLMRTQWTGIEGAPTSGLVTFATPLKSKRKHIYSARQGIGGKFEHDQIGPFTANRFMLSYAAHFNFSEYNRLSVGISAGFQQWSFDKTKTTTYLPDPAISESNSALSPNVAAGFWWNGEHYYLGTAFEQIPAGSWGEIGTSSRFRFHSMINGGYRFLVKDKISLIPNFMLRIPPKGKMDLDIAALVDFQNKVGLGLGLRNTDAVLFFFNIKIKEQFSIAYSFDFVTSALGENRSNSHEISLSFIGCKPTSSNKTVCPLFE